jgi:dihydrofolate reductase
MERAFDPEVVRRMKASTAQVLTIGGPNLAAQAFKAGLIDHCQLFIAPVVVGDGKSAFPRGVRLEFALQEERRFGNGTVYLHYRSARNQAA